MYLFVTLVLFVPLIPPVYLTSLICFVNLYPLYIHTSCTNNTFVSLIPFISLYPCSFIPHTFLYLLSFFIPLYPLYPYIPCIFFIPLYPNYLYTSHTFLPLVPSYPSYLHTPCIFLTLVPSYPSYFCNTLQVPQYLLCLCTLLTFIPLYPFYLLYTLYLCIPHSILHPGTFILPCYPCTPSTSPITDIPTAFIPLDISTCYTFIPLYLCTPCAPVSLLPLYPPYLYKLIPI